MAEVILALGANLGDPVETFKKTIKLLEVQGVSCKRLSSVYCSRSLLLDEQPDYYNMVGIFNTVKTPSQLLTTVKDIEKVIGRVDTGRWKERLIDIDIIDYGNIIYESPSLTIPHKHMNERVFVILPLMEIHNGYRHPKISLSLKEIYSTISLDLGIYKTGKLV